MITPIKARIVDADRQCTEFLITHEGEEYRWHGNTPRFDVKEDLQKWLDANEERILCDLCRKLYPQAKVGPGAGETPLQAWQAWIAGACTNTDTEWEPPDDFVKRYQLEQRTLTQVTKATAIIPTEVTVDDNDVSKVTDFILKDGFIKQNGKFWQVSEPSREDAMLQYEASANRTVTTEQIEKQAFRHTWGTEEAQTITY